MKSVTLTKESGKAMSKTFSRLMIAVLVIASCFSVSLQAQTIKIDDLSGKTQTPNGPQVQTFPNPSTGDITIKPGDKSEITRLKIVDNSGNVLYDIPINGRTLIPHNLSKGTYIFEVHTDTGIFRRLIVFTDN